eukprot:775496-Amphidinium_carterae.2
MLIGQRYALPLCCGCCGNTLFRISLKGNSSKESDEGCNAAFDFDCSRCLKRSLSAAYRNWTEPCGSEPPESRRQTCSRG